MPEPEGEETVEFLFQGYKVSVICCKTLCLQLMTQYCALKNLLREKFSYCVLTKHTHTYTQTLEIIGYVYYLGCGDGITSVHICTNE